VREIQKTPYAGRIAEDRQQTIVVLPKILRHSLIERRLPPQKGQDCMSGQCTTLKRERDAIAYERIDKARGISDAKNAILHRFGSVKKEWRGSDRIAERFPSLRALFQRGVETEDVLQIAGSIRADHRARVHASFFKV
jgi:hypothetical protein